MLNAKRVIRPGGTAHGREAESVGNLRAIRQTVHGQEESQTTVTETVKGKRKGKYAQDECTV